MDQILLEGIAGNYYMNASRYDKIAAVEGVGQITRQFYLTSAKASCCSARVQIIGFDPEDDFVITPWIGDSRGGSIEDGCVLAGSDIAVPEDGLITIDDFAKVKLVTAKVIACERVPKSDKLLKETLEVGGETRTVLSGIAQWYTPEEMVGKTVVLVANLAPRKIRGIESNGMLLCAATADDTALRLLTVDGDIPDGCAIS